MQETFSKMKVSNHMIDRMLNEMDEEVNENGDKINKKRILVCTKCAGSSFTEQADLRKHFKTEWHIFNSKLSAKDKDSLTEEDYNDYIMMNAK
jgi:hypothetical protein